MFVLSLPLDARAGLRLALLAFVGGLSAATGMVIVEAIAVSGMVCNDLVMPLLLRTAAFRRARRRPTSAGMLLGHPPGGDRAGPAAAGVHLFPPGRGSLRAGQSIGPDQLSRRWRSLHPPCWAACTGSGGNREGALTGPDWLGFLLWAYTLMLPSIAKSGLVVRPAFLQRRARGGIQPGCKPEQLLGLSRAGSTLTHSLFWSLLRQCLCAVCASSRCARAPSAAGSEPAPCCSSTCSSARRAAGAAGVLARHGPSSA